MQIKSYWTLLTTPGYLCSNYTNEHLTFHHKINFLEFYFISMSSIYNQWMFSISWNGIFFACSGSRAMALEPFLLNPSTPVLCGYSFNEQRSIAMGMLAVHGLLKSVSFCPRQGHWMTLLNLCPLFLEILSRPWIQLFQRVESSESRLQQLCSVCWGGDPLVSFRKMKKGKRQGIHLISMPLWPLFVSQVAFQVAPRVHHTFLLRL